MWGKDRTTEEIKCSEVNAPDIYIEAVPKQKIVYLMEEYHHQEWLAYLVGRESEQKNFFVEDISIPPHAQASGGMAEAEPFHIPDKCIGIIHSHHGMGAFHSGTDQAYVDRNFPVSITVARSGNNLTYDAVSVKKTPCGKMARLSCTVKYVQPPPLFDKDKFLKEAKENIDKGKAVYQGYQGVRYGMYPGYGIYRGGFGNPHALLYNDQEEEAGWDGITYEYLDGELVPKIRGRGESSVSTKPNEDKPKWGQNGKHEPLVFPRLGFGRKVKIPKKEKKELKKIQEILKGKYNVQIPLPEVKRLVDQGHYHGIKLEDVKEIKEVTQAHP